MSAENVIARMKERWITKREAAKIAGVCEKTIYNHRIDYGAMPHGKKYRYPITRVLVKSIEKEELKHV